jgi:hypothetical protein
MGGEMLSCSNVFSSGSSGSQRLVAALAAALLAACDGDSLGARASPPEDKLQVLRIREDPERNRLWSLGSDAVLLHHSTTGKLLQRIVLPGWVYVGREFGCPPDLALDRSGTVFVTSNVLPALWRIDPVRFEVTMLELARDADQDKDMGFTGLAFGADETLIASNAIHGSVWQIDLHAASARKVASYRPVRGVCEPPNPLRGR